MAGKLNLKENMTLASKVPLDNIFSTEELRQEAKLQKVYEIPLSEIKDFPDHPYKVRDDEVMQNLTDSIKSRGVDTPVLLRPLEGSGYEMVSGHRRKRACELAGKDTIPAIIEEMTRDEAIIKMVESNYQRDTILPSEKAFAYKMRLEAMKRQGERSDLTSSQIGMKLKRPQSSEILAENSNESKNQIHRFIRLTELVPSLLEMVDERGFALNAAVEISYINAPLQEQLLQAIEQQECTPTLAQARRLRIAAENGSLDFNGMKLVLSEEKPIENKVILKGERFEHLIPKGYDTPRQKENYVIDALAFYQRHRERQKEQQNISR